MKHPIRTELISAAMLLSLCLLTMWYFQFGYFDPKWVSPLRFESVPQHH